MSPSAIDKALAQLDQIIAEVQSGSSLQGTSADAKKVNEAPRLQPDESGEWMQVIKPGSSTEPAIVGPPVPPGGVSDKAGVPPSDAVHPSGTPAAKEKGKKGRQAVPPATSTGNEKEDNFNKAYLAVGRIASVEDHPMAEKLLVCKVEVAPGEFKQVVAGLKKHIPKEQLILRMVCLILNLKPAKLAGTPSEAMILAGDGPLAEGSSPADDNRLVKVLDPPGDASIGDRIFLKGGAPSENTAKQLSSKIWEKIVPLLQVQGGCATYDGRALVTATGAVTVQELPDGSGIH